MFRQATKNDIDSLENISRESLALGKDLLGLLIESYPSLLHQKDGQIDAFWVSEALDDELLLLRDFAVSRESRFHKIGRTMISRLNKQARQDGYRTILFVADSARGEDFLLRSGWGVIYETGSSRIFSHNLL